MVLCWLCCIDKDDFLVVMGIGLCKGVDEIFVVNGVDVDCGCDVGMDEVFFDCLIFILEWIEGMVVGLEGVVYFDDFVGEVVCGWYILLGVKVE